MSQRTVTGQISVVNSKPFEDKRTGNPITLHSFQLEGYNQWFRTGQKAIPAGVGQSVKFVADGANVDVTTFSVEQATVAKAPSVAANTTIPASMSSARSTGASGGNSKDNYWADKEARDLVKEARYQEVSEPRMALSVAVSAAGNLVAAAITKDALTFGTAAKSKRVGILTEYTKELALDLALFIQDAPILLPEYRKSLTSKPSPVSATTTSESVGE